MRRFQARALPHGGFWNRTVRAVGKLMTFECGSWGPGGYGGGLAYHVVGPAIPSYLTGDVVDDPLAGWMIPHTTKPTWTNGYGAVMGAFSDASVIRQNNPLLPHVTGADFLLNRSGLKDPAVVMDPGVGPVFGDRLRSEDPDSEEVTADPDNWDYPGGYDSQGRPWAQNPDAPALDTPYWKYCDAQELMYRWYPAFTPSLMVQTVWGGYDYLVGWWAGIHCNVAGIGIPIELQIGATPRVVRAKCELGMSMAEARTVTITATSASDPGTITEDTAALSVSMVLLGGRTRIVEGVPVTGWSVLGSWPAGTYTNGKTCVVDVAGPLQTMIDRSGEFDTFGMMPGVGLEFLGGSNTEGIRGLLGPEPEMEWDASAQTWFIKRGVWRTLEWSGYSLGAPVVEVELPASELDRCVVARPWPSMG